MTTTHERLRSSLRSLHNQLSTEEAAAIVDVSRLAAMADGRTDIDEMIILTSIAKIVYEMAGVDDIPVPTGKVDTKRLLDIGLLLELLPARELCYASAFLVMIQDLDLTKEETEMSVKLADALLLDHARAKELATDMETYVRSVRGEA